MTKRKAKYTGPEVIRSQPVGLDILLVEDGRVRTTCSIADLPELIARLQAHLPRCRGTCGYTDRKLNEAGYCNNCAPPKRAKKAGRR